MALCQVPILQGSNTACSFSFPPSYARPRIEDSSAGRLPPPRSARVMLSEPASPCAFLSFSPPSHVLPSLSLPRTADLHNHRRSPLLFRHAAFRLRAEDTLRRRACRGLL